MTSRLSVLTTALAAASGMALLTLASPPVPDRSPGPGPASADSETPAAMLASLTTPVSAASTALAPPPGEPERPQVVTPTGGLGDPGATGWDVGPDANRDPDGARSMEFNRPTLVIGLAPRGAIRGAGGGPGLGSTASFAAPPAEGGTTPLGATELRSAIKRQMPKLRACYERALKQDGRLEGRMMLAWKVRADGGVKDVRLAKDNLKEPRLARCVVDTVAGWRFPRGTEEIGVEYPLVLSTNQPG